MKRWIESLEIPAAEMKKAHMRQLLHGGKLTESLLTLGLISSKQLIEFELQIPKPPTTIERTGLQLTFITDLATKHILFMGEFDQQELAERVCLPVNLVDKVMEQLRRAKLVEVLGAGGYSSGTYRYLITDAGKKRAQELLDICRYVGPTPVSLSDYVTMVDGQTIRLVAIDQQQINEAFAHLVVSPQLLTTIGPAISSGRSIFLYGPSGNGKTAIAEAIGRVFQDPIFVPHALYVAGQIITVYDPVTHFPVSDEDQEPRADRRWIRVKRPVVMAGGELTLSMLDLTFNQVTKYYEAPLQMKANNGIFLIDDFGRQQVEPRILLNRWIVPLERRVDFMGLHTGMKFTIPFDLLVLFATNIEPGELVDEAFLRRIRYKVRIDHPTIAEYEDIFKRVCEVNGIEFQPPVFSYLTNELYGKSPNPMAACHPRDIIDHLVDQARFHKTKPVLTKEALDQAWKTYFV
ncbi:ATPase [Oryzomonas rubra]|uniref:ATPase n=2 Tax=Oryzomonas rubra TaxID=2509454 RepID=A0A5A9XFT5_9BACT|nr:ATPase [Oryzomonas rubra]